MQVKDKVIVVSGAGSGMGRELTIQLVKKGATVAMVDLHEETMAETAELAGEEKTSSYALNIADKAEVEKYVAFAIKHHGAVDGIINNAGIIQPFININELEMSAIERVMNVNFYGTVNMTKGFLPHLMSRPVAHIANVSSMGGFIPFPGQTIYGASKAAVKLFTEGLYAELKDTNVGVTVIHPGAVNTNIMSNSGIEGGDAANSEDANKTLSAEKAASIMINAIEKNKFRVMVGKDARMLDILYRLSPRKAVNIITKMMSKYKQ